ncbi:MAG: ATP-binding cassette domain-containing protein [Candidatus Omnitrophica bacterium]|nr:ATP-binding cassette domain-containing protein [Candidatus Omnitrophota bacterium]
MIKVNNLSMSYGPIRALQDISFEVKEHEIVGLLGPNGAGKTTLMRVLTTFFYPTSGSAKINGIDITEDPLSVRKIIGYLPETPPLYMDMRVDEFINFVGLSRGLSGRELKERIGWVVEAVKIGDVWKHMVSELSLGFRQRVGLAQALIHDPKVVILDEPTSGLDPMQIVSMRKLIKDLASEKTIIFSTHILQEVSSVAERLVIIDHGKIIANSLIAELKKEKTGVSFLFVSFKASKEDAQRALGAINALKEVNYIGNIDLSPRFLCLTHSIDKALIAINALIKEKGWLLRELSFKEPSLEEVFLGLFKRAG